MYTLVTKLEINIDAAFKYKNRSQSAPAFIVMILSHVKKETKSSGSRVSSQRNFTCNNEMYVHKFGHVQTPM